MSENSLGKYEMSFVDQNKITDQENYGDSLDQELNMIDPDMDMDDSDQTGELPNAKTKNFFAVCHNSSILMINDFLNQDPNDASVRVHKGKAINELFNKDLAISFTMTELDVSGEFSRTLSKKRKHKLVNLIHVKKQFLLDNMFLEFRVR